MSIYRKDEAGKLRKVAGGITQRVNNVLLKTQHTVVDNKDYYEIIDADKYIKNLADYTNYLLYIDETNETNTVYIKYKNQILQVQSSDGLSIDKRTLFDKVELFTLDASESQKIILTVSNTISEVVLIGAEGIIENNHVVFTVEDSESFIGLKTNQREFLLSAVLSNDVGEIDRSLPVNITFGDTTYNVYSYIKGAAESVKIGDIFGNSIYSTETGYSFTLKIIYIETSDVTGFILMPSNVLPLQLTKIIKNSQLDPTGTWLEVGGGGSSMTNIADASNKSLIGNDIQTNIIKTDGYIDSQGVWKEISGTPILVSDINANIESAGYYVIPKSLIESGAFGYALYQFLDGAIGTPIKNYIGKISTTNSYWLTNTYNYNSANMNAFGSNNLVSGDGSLVVGSNNKNAGYNSLIIGKNNTSNAGESIVGGLNNTNLGGSSAVFGVSNNVNDNQGLATGYHNKISTGSLYSTATGIGNVTKGLANFVAGDYNYTGSDYNTAIGSQNIVGGNITYNNIPITEIQDYSPNSQYLIGSIVKLNGYVYKALVNNPSRPELNSNEWQVIKPVTTKDNSTNSFSGGSKNVINSSNSFAYGTGLIINKENQTVLGKFNNININASLIVGNGTDNDSRENIFEVLSNGQINLKDRINISAGSKTAVLRNTTSGDFVISGEDGVAIRPSGTSGTTGSIIFRPTFVGPQSSNVDLGSSARAFNNLYLAGKLSDGTNEVTIADLANSGQDISGKVDKLATSPNISLYRKVNNTSTSQQYISTSRGFEYNGNIPTKLEAKQYVSVFQNEPNFQIIGNSACNSGGSKKYTTLIRTSTSNKANIFLRCNRYEGGSSTSSSSSAQCTLDSEGSIKVSLTSTNDNDAKQVTQLGIYNKKIDPYDDNSIDLGTSSSKFKDLYLSGKLSDGTNEVTIADLANSGQDISSKVDKAYVDTDAQVYTNVYNGKYNVTDSEGNTSNRYGTAMTYSLGKAYNPIIDDEDLPSYYGGIQCIGYNHNNSLYHRVDIIEGCTEGLTQKVAGMIITSQDSTPLVQMNVTKLVSTSSGDIDLNNSYAEIINFNKGMHFANFLNDNSFSIDYEGITATRGADGKEYILKYSDLANSNIASITINQPASAVNGTLTDEQLNTLQSAANSYILFNNEKYYDMDPQHESGALVYTHVGHDNSDHYNIKCITITISTKGWVLNSIKVPLIEYNESTNTLSITT